VLKVTNSSELFDENDFKLSKLKTNIQNKKYKHASRLCRIIEIATQINTIGCVEEASLISFE
jgi:alpha-L-arabinofuranosidase